MPCCAFWPRSAAEDGANYVPGSGLHALEPVVRHQPLLAAVVAERLRAGHREHAPALEPQCGLRAVRLTQEGDASKLGGCAACSAQPVQSVRASQNGPLARAVFSASLVACR